jgi:hypothetical protein
MKKLYFILAFILQFSTLFAQTHFTPAFVGNGYNHMNIYILESLIDGEPMEAGDEIAVFDGDVCAGAIVLTESLIDSTAGIIFASKADQDTSGAYLENGYIPGNPIIFKLWDASALKEYDAVDISFIDPATNQEIDPVPFNFGASAFVRLSYFVQTDLYDITSENRILESKVFPNPFDTHLNIAFNKVERENLTIGIYDLNGRMIKRIDDSGAYGANTLHWNGTDGSGNKVKAGMYLIMLYSGSRKEALSVIYRGGQ